MVTVERRKPFENQILRPNHQHTHTVVERLSPFIVHSSSLFDDDIFVNKDMELDTKVFDSMFPSLYNGIRRGRNYSYDVTSPHLSLEKSDFYEEQHLSSSVNVIPIKVEYYPERYQDDKNIRFRLLNGSPKNVETGRKAYPLSSGDHIPKLTDFASSYQSSLVQSKPPKDHHISLHKATSDTKNKATSPKSLTASTVRSFDEDGFPHFDSIHNLWTYSAENGFCEKEMDLWKSVPVHHLESSHTPTSKEKPNSNNNSSGKKGLYDPTSSSSTNVPAAAEDIDHLSMICTSDPSISSIHTSFDGNADNEFDEREINHPPSYPIYDVLKVKLAPEKRKIDYIKGDGNCFFRALSKGLYGSEKYHKTIRSLIVDIIATNKAKFAPFVDKEDVQEHVKLMSEDHYWATTCEIYAAATLLQRDVFLLTPDHLNENYSWLLFKPVFPLEETHSSLPSHQCYMTLCNTNGNHYDRVASHLGGCNCFLPQPVLGEVGTF
uniref:OTU domain-containing protein n=1 Tax=Arion vulgaris TaxID=1028688 RepID=A0A0B7B5S1_9EUPU